MTPGQFDALAQLMQLRQQSASREALRLVLINGWTTYGAANSSGIPASNVCRQVARARRVIELAATLAGPQQ